MLKIKEWCFQKTLEKTEDKMKKNLFFICLLIIGFIGSAQNAAYKSEWNIPYYNDSVNQTDEYCSEQ